MPNSSIISTTMAIRRVTIRIRSNRIAKEVQHSNSKTPINFWTTLCINLQTKTIMSIIILTKTISLWLISAHHNSSSSKSNSNRTSKTASLQPIIRLKLLKLMPRVRCTDGPTPTLAIWLEEACHQVHCMKRRRILATQEITILMERMEPIIVKEVGRVIILRRWLWICIIMSYKNQAVSNKSSSSSSKKWDKSNFSSRHKCFNSSNLSIKCSRRQKGCLLSSNSNSISWNNNNSKNKVSSKKTNNIKQSKVCESADFLDWK